MGRIEIDELEWVMEPPDPTAKAYNAALVKRTQAAEAKQVQKKPLEPKAILYKPPPGPTVAQILPEQLAREKRINEFFARRRRSNARIRYGKHPDRRIFATNIINPDRLGFPTVKDESGETTVLATTNEIPVIPRVARNNTVVVRRHEYYKRDPYHHEFKRISPPLASWVGAEQSVLNTGVLPPSVRSETVRARRRVDRIK